MDVQRYISSGIIESYVVGLVSEQEAREVENAIAEYPEVKAAVEACRQDMELYVGLHAVSPPKTIRTQILNVIENESSLEGEALLPEELRDPEAPASPFAGFKMPAIKLTRERIWQLAILVAVLLLAISLIINYVYAGRYKNFRKKYGELRTAQTALTAESQAYQAKLQATEQELVLLKNPDFKWIRLQGMGKHTGQLATIVWNQQSKEVYLLSQALPESGPDQQYQLWAIVNGKPVDAGVLETGKPHNTLQKMKQVTAAQVFAITLEKKGGSPGPTVDQVFVAGKVNSY